MKAFFIAATFFLLSLLSYTQVTLYSYNFGTSSNSNLNGTGEFCAASKNSNYSSGCSSYGWAGSSSIHYITTRAIALPASGDVSLTFNYRYGSFSSYPTVQISTACGGTFTTLITLSYKSSCGAQVVDLNAYKGQTIYLRFDANYTTYFVIDDIVVTSIPSCMCSCAGSCIDSDQTGNWNDCNTWGILDGDVSCIGWASATILGSRKEIIASGHTVTVPVGISTVHDKTLGVYIQAGGTLTLNDELDGFNSTNADNIYICGTMNVSHSGTSDFREATLTVGDGGVLNLNSGVLYVYNVIVESGGVINLSGGELRIDGGSYTIEVKQGGLININSGSSRINYYGFSTEYCKIDGTIDCKNSLTAINYSNFDLNEVCVSSNTSTGRIRTQNAYTPLTSSSITASNNFFGFNDEYGGTVEYYGSSAINLTSSSRYHFYDLEVNTTGGLYLYYSVCTSVSGNLYLTGGNLNLNSKQINVHGTFIYSGTNYINAGAGGGKVHVQGKTRSIGSPCVNYF